MALVFRPRQAEDGENFLNSSRHNHRAALLPMTHEEEPYIDPLELAAANARHDLELRRLGIDQQLRFKPGFKPHLAILRGPLTDRKITRYAKQGFYSEEFREFRRKTMQKKSRRQGNFVQTDGRFIYSPL